jgi:hypothetical protein
MAIVNEYVDVNLGATPPKLSSNVHVVGGESKEAIVSFVIGASDQAGSIYRLFKGLSPDIIVTALDIWCDAITGGTSISMGAYVPLDYDNIGAAISAACFASAVDLHVGVPITGAPTNMMAAVTIANRNVPAYLLYGDAQYPAKHPAWDLGMVMTAMTTGGGTANVHVRMRYVQL